MASTGPSRAPRPARTDERHAPPGPFRRSFWRSPVRGVWLTAALSVVLLVGVTVVFVTGALSYAAYDPGLGGTANDTTPDKGLLGFYLFTWPTGPTWLYRLTQGVHVTLGLVLIPVLLAKLWSVIPKLFEWPPTRSLAHALERLSLLLLVGGAVLEFGTGLLDIQLWYVFPVSFYPLHYYGAWVFIAAFVAHAALRMPRTVSALRSRRSGTPRTGPVASHPRPDTDGLAATRPDPPTISRRGVLGLVGAGSLLVLALSVGQSIGGRWRHTALLAPRGGDGPGGPLDFPVNKTAAGVGVTAAQTGAGWRLELRAGARSLRLSREALLAMPQQVSWLPIACVEGWSTPDQRWSGIRLGDLARLVGAPQPDAVLIESLQSGGAFGHVRLAANQIADPGSLLALRVNGRDLSLDHGFPARIIVPAAPGVHNTKWVARMVFEGGDR
ncbi:MAG: molybdopterin-dependent oxidoreductase [Actinocatenispora sp.]